MYKFYQLLVSRFPFEFPFLAVNAAFITVCGISILSWQGFILIIHMPGSIGEGLFLFSFFFFFFFFFSSAQ